MMFGTWEIMICKMRIYSDKSVQINPKKYTHSYVSRKENELQRLFMVFVW